VYKNLAPKNKEKALAATGRSDRMEETKVFLRPDMHKSGGY